MDIKNWAYWFKGGVAGLALQLVLLIMYCVLLLLSGNAENIPILLINFQMFLPFILTLTILFGLIGSIVDLLKNKKVTPLVLSLLLLFMYLSWFLMQIKF